MLCWYSHEIWAGFETSARQKTLPLDDVHSSPLLPHIKNPEDVHNGAKYSFKSCFHFQNGFQNVLSFSKRERFCECGFSFFQTKIPDT